VGLLLLLAVVPGCAPGRRAGPEPDRATSGAENASGAEKANGAEKAGGATVTRLPGGREGFDIREQVDLEARDRAAFDQAVALLKSGRHAEAILLLEPVVASSPAVTAPYIDLAIACRHEGRPEQAEKCLKAALQRVPGHPVASNEYGLLLRRAGRFDEARAVYEKALAEFPEYLSLRRNLGILCDLYLGDQACALEQYRIYSEGKPEDEEVRIWIADLKLRMANP
jgi:tetratricopeptide (TPR) repeat protein